jgi:hypothetical protein
LVFEEAISFNLNFNKGEKENTIKNGEEQLLKITTEPIIYFYNRNSSLEYLTIKGDGFN